MITVYSETVCVCVFLTFGTIIAFHLPFIIIIYSMFAKHGSCSTIRCSAFYFESLSLDNTLSTWHFHAIYCPNVMLIQCYQMSKSKKDIQFSPKHSTECFVCALHSAIITYVIENFCFGLCQNININAMASHSILPSAIDEYKVFVRSVRVFWTM